MGLVRKDPRCMQFLLASPLQPKTAICGDHLGPFTMVVVEKLLPVLDSMLLQREISGMSVELKVGGDHRRYKHAALPSLSDSVALIST